MNWEGPDNDELRDDWLINHGIDPEEDSDGSEM